MPSSARQISAADWRSELLKLDPLQLAPASLVLAECSRQTQIVPHALASKDPLLSGAEALLDYEAVCIWYDASLPKSRRLLILAHEFAHYALHLPYKRQAQPSLPAESSPQMELSGYSQFERRERAADEWAAELLLPLSALEAAYFGMEQSVVSIAAAIELNPEFVASRLRKLLLTGFSRRSASAKDKPAHSSFFPSMDTSQLNAAKSSSRYALVTAGPGTGKTRALAARYEFLVHEKHVDPSTIVMLTFSRRAAGELQQRCDMLRSDGSQTPWIGTVHAYAYELLRRFSAEAALRSGWSVISTRDAEQFMDRRLAALSKSGMHLPTLPVSSLLRMISQCKEQGITESAFHLIRNEIAVGHDPQTDGADRNQLDEFQEFYSKYQNTLADANKVDFGDLLMIGTNLLAGDSNVREQARTRCRHLLIDEVQDLTPAALKFVEMIVGGPKQAVPGETTTTLWAVGDRLQSIYRFQSGGSSCGMESFSKLFDQTDQYTLAVNYRSSQKIVSVLSDVAATLTAAEPQRHQSWASATAGVMRDADSSPGDISITTAAEEASQYDAMAGEISRLQLQGTALREQAVLCRTNAECALVADALSCRGVAVLDAVPWLKSSAVRNLMKALEAVALQIDTNSNELNLSLNSWQAQLPMSAADFVQSTVFERSDELRRRWRALSCGDSAPDEMAAIGALLTEAIRWEREDEVEHLGQEQGRTARLAAFARHIRSLHRYGQNGYGESIRDNADSDGVRVMTVHAAKGLEFDAVFLPNMLDGVFPIRTTGRRAHSLERCFEEERSSGSAIDEESCLFFVAISRSRRYLRLSYPEMYHSGRRLKRSPFLRLLQSTASGSSIQMLRASSSSKNKSSEHGLVVKEEVSGAILEQLSQSDIATYEACPRLYRYKCNTDRSELHALAPPSGITAEPVSVLDSLIAERQAIEISADSTARKAVLPPTRPSAKDAHPNKAERLLQRLQAAFSKPTIEQPARSGGSGTASPEQARRLRAASGIASGRFPPAPDYSGRCADCPFLYRCPN